MRVAEQIGILVALNEGIFDPIPLDEIAETEEKIRKAVTAELGDLCHRIERGEEISQDDIRALAETARKARGNRSSVITCK